MNELSRHIEILLLTNDCVIVPGFGGFVAHYVEAECVAEEALFVPPHRVLGFNSQLQIGDLLLAQSYVDAYDISYPEAVTRIENEVAEIRSEIERCGECEFHGIGTVSRTTDGHYEFEPCTAGILTPSLYALNPYVLEERDIVAASDDAENKRMDAALNPAVVTADVEDDIEDEVENEEQEPGVYITFRRMWYAAAAAMLLLLLPLAYSSLPVGRGSGEVIKSSVGDTGREVASKIGEGIEFLTTKKVESTVAGQLEKAETAAPEETAERQEQTVASAAKADKYYTIMLASRVSRKGADNCIASLTRKGLRNAAVRETASMRQVVYGRYDSEREAKQALADLQSKDDIFEGTWVVKVSE